MAVTDSPPPPPPPPHADRAPAPTPPADPAGELELPAGLEWKAGALLLFTLALLLAAAVYLLYARGAFEPTQRLVLIADDSEGVSVGMNLTFSGFPIGRVRAIELGDDGNAHIVIDVPKKDAKWLRESSVFTLVRGLVGGVSIRAYSGVLSDPPLPPGAQRRVLAGDATAEAQRVLTQAREFVAQLSQLASEDGAVGSLLAQLKTTTERLNGPRGALGVLTGNDADAKKILLAIERTNALLARLDGLAARGDRLVERADQQLFGAADGSKPGAVGEARAALADARGALQRLDALLADARASLVKVDAVLAEAQAVGRNARTATEDLDALRAEVDATLRRVDGLLADIKRRWPFGGGAKPIELP
jgi:phospholipid/cholesterol/gamma-HCH transport system substrate-binding protein